MSGIVYCQSFLLELIDGTHNLSSDTIMVALFDGSASFSSSTTAYTTSNEVTNGSGYTTGGLALTLTSTYPKLESGGAAVRFENAAWTLTGQKTIRWALIYNSSKSNRAILSIDLGGASAYNGTFTINFPSAQAPIIWAKAPT
jgi:hypothetical protein